MKLTTQEKCKQLFDTLKEAIPFFGDFRDNAFIAGGCIRSIITGEDIKDVDIFLKDASLINKLKDLNLGFTSENAITFYVDKMQYQIIINTTGSPLDLINEFDFTMNMNYYEPLIGYLYIASLNDINDRQLTINPKCRNKLGTLARLSKFIGRGYKAPDRLNLLQIGVALTECKTVSTFEELEKESRFHFSEAEFDKVDFVEKPERESLGLARFITHPTSTYDYSKTLSAKSTHGGSGL